MTEATKPFCLIYLCIAFTSASYCQSTEVEKLAASIRTRLEVEHQHQPSATAEFWKIAAGPLTTLVVSGIGAWYLKRLEHRQKQEQIRLEAQIDQQRSINQLLLEKALEQRQWTNQKLLERRFAVFDKMAPALNDIFCLLAKVGSWKEIEPPAAIKSKRMLDKEVYVNAALFPENFREAYFACIHSCFGTWRGPAKNAQLRGTLDGGRTSPEANWRAEWADMFTDEKDPLLASNYKALMKAFGEVLWAESTPSQSVSLQQGELPERADVATPQ